MHVNIIFLLRFQRIAINKILLNICQERTHCVEICEFDSHSVAFELRLIHLWKSEREHYDLNNAIPEKMPPSTFLISGKDFKFEKNGTK